MDKLPPHALEQVAGYFRALSEPTRLRIINLLREGERSVGDIAGLFGFTPANISRHLAFLMAQGLVERESRGTWVYYRIADESVYDLCELVCGSIARRLEQRADEQRAFAQVAGSRGRQGPRTL
jgi:DNA-binding transcriptional ArsR family regulator